MLAKPRTAQQTERQPTVCIKCHLTISDVYRPEPRHSIIKIIDSEPGRVSFNLILNVLPLIRSRHLSVVKKRFQCDVLWITHALEEKYSQFVVLSRFWLFRSPASGRTGELSRCHCSRERDQEEDYKEP